MLTPEQKAEVKTCLNCKSLNTVATKIDFRHLSGKRFCKSCGMDYLYRIDRETGELEKEITDILYWPY